jgi:hypothetical protein
MSRWSSPSSTDPLAAALVAALALVCAGCSDDAPRCGPEGAPADGITLSIGGETVTYGSFTASINNDCTIAGSGVISVSIHGSQVGGTGSLTLCLPRPDLIGAAAVPLSPPTLPPDPADRVQLVDASASLAADCTVARDPGGAPAAQATFTGYCAGDPAGYALALAGTLALRRTCPAGTDTVGGTIAGAAAVVVQ